MSREPSESSAARVLRTYGLSFESTFPFAAPLLAGHQPADLRFEVVDQPPIAIDSAAAHLAYRSPFPAPDGASRLQLYRQEGCDVLHLHRLADFFLFEDRIACRALDPEHAYMAELGFLGSALSLWLERTGVPALHGSAVVLDGRTAGFLAPSTGGKSTLAAALLRSGGELLSEDVLPVEAIGSGFSARPGYPELRLQTDTLELLGIAADDLPRLYPGSPKRRLTVGRGFGCFHPEARPLAALYLLAREEGRRTTAIESLSPRDAVAELVRSSFAPRLTEALGLSARRLDFLCDLATGVPLRRLRYPSELARLDEVGEAIRRDLSARPATEGESWAA